MGQSLIGLAKQAARLLIIELFVPGGTLIVLSILLAGRVPAISDRFASLSPLLTASKRPRHQEDLVAYWGLRRFR
jgi:hypothetical protein